MDAAHLLDLKFAILRARHSEPEHSVLYRSAYELWLKLWSPALKQLGHGENIRSDVFCRHQEVAAFFHYDEPVAIMLIDSYDLSNQVDLQHSYFTPFPPKALEALEGMDFRQVMVIGNLAVAHRWRGRDAAIAEMMIGMCVLRFVHSRFDGIVAYSRNTKGTQHMAYRCGGEAVLANAQAWDEPTDFIVFDAESQAVLNQHPRRQLMQKLWDERIQEEARHPLFEEPVISRSKNLNGPIATTSGENNEQRNHESSDQPGTSSHPLADKRRESDDANW